MDHNDLERFLSEDDRSNLLVMLEIYSQEDLRGLLAVAVATGRPESVRLVQLAISLKNS